MVTTERRLVLFAVFVCLGCPPPPPSLASASSESGSEDDTVPRSCVDADAHELPGVVTVDPDGRGAAEPFDAYCDEHGWMLVGEIGEAYDIQRESFNVDRLLANLLAPDIASDGLANFGFDRFAAYQTIWTFRSVVSDSTAEPPWSQVTFFRAREGEIVTPDRKSVV